MMDETWADIHSRRLTIPSGVEARVEAPPGPPRCDTHCTGRHQTEATLACAGCRGAPVYRIVNHERRGRSGQWFYTVEPMNGSPEVGRPPFVCATCGDELRRWP
jgi:hypothetical protein